MRPTVLAFLCYGLAPFSWVPCVAQEPPATLQIQMPESKLASGTPIRLDVIAKNIATDDLLVWKASPQDDGEAEAYIYVQVRDAAGKSLLRIDGTTIVVNGKKYVRPKSWFTRKGIIVAPEHELRDFLVLSNLFDLSKPGNYSVSATLEIPGSAELMHSKPEPGPEPKFIEVESNKITFAVTETGPQ